MRHRGPWASSCKFDASFATSGEPEMESEENRSCGCEKAIESDMIQQVYRFPFPRFELPINALGE